MAKATKPLGGGAKDKYLKELIGSAGLDADAAKQLTETARREIAGLRVRLPMVERTAPPKPRPSQPAPAPVTASQPPPAAKTSTPDTPAAPSAPPAPTPTPAADAAGKPSEPFDPYAFSATVVLKRKGKAELERLLAAVTEPAHLKLIAEKQHLGLLPEAKTAAEMRAGIVAAAEARINDRRAAAS